ncbi:MAG: hypothetical protein BBJ57_02445 [Desulfobacterales bacterium PC51MH44]|nr:MAG: hypothetical protein BBJ57_02445 [Desulfobacterales bacterium PC51MH44]
MVLDCGIIFYTDNRIQEPIRSAVRNTIKAPDLPIISCSLKPINFGDNIVVKGKRSYPMMIKQILTALENSNTKYVFFCEHDVLYHPSHFDFTPETDEKYYYNINNWRWDYPNNRAIQYDGLTSLSMMCCNRKLAIRHYQLRTKLIKEQGLEKIRSREPRWARRFGYEPGTKPKRRGGVSNEISETWRSEFPNIDIRHKRTFSNPKTTLDSFRHPPLNWKEVTLNEIPYWNLWNYR